ncbi:YbhB/YbcL family Raf kinase inhibitor-like protein [Sandaracinus amylolyticus]|uniref:YbhB/YbcL family Raf kinase inhibitor-like protein n=1 Tax=Sandaracinus amylolyticus TaxID=927083 RepID=UPI001F2511C9|nr:YbhB/YbcL family Raf kinase inhibitor-like protein [Sandaracinus amylolyticus]UJR84480.1 Hypothetical protein I5071_65590 [Sandaracinus amylolyticus]
MQLIDGLARLAGRALRGVRAGERNLAKNVLRAPETMRVHSESFRHEALIPAVHTDSEGRNVSPALAWTPAPAGTKELVLLCEDPDIPKRKPFAHWVVYRISPDVTSVDAGIAIGDSPRGAIQGRSSVREEGWLGPHPPQGHGPHRYHFQLFALDAPTGLGPGATRDQVVHAMRGKVLACGDLVGIYTR